jgi:asparagine synthase (glutamine-hydrolysing)
MAKGGVAITFNGEIYNHQELRAELVREGVSFDSRCDTEVLLEMYRREGDNCLRRLDGMFSFVAVDEQGSRALCARDRIGEKPLYYRVLDGLIAVASEPAAFRSMGLLDTSLDPVGLAQFLTMGYTLPPHTVYSSLRALPPGHLLEIDLRSGSCQERCYYDLAARLVGLSQESSEEPDYPREFSEAVSSRLMSDAQIGVMLSGGVDSTLVAIYASESPSRGLRAYTAGWNRESRYNEFEAAARTCEILGIQHTRVVWDQESSWNSLVSALADPDVPFSDVNSWAIQRICEEARTQGVKVLLSGDGGDELLAGYPKRRIQKLLLVLEVFLRTRGRRAVAISASHLLPYGWSRPRKLARLLSVETWKDALLIALGNGTYPDEAEILTGARPEIEGYSGLAMSLEEAVRRPQIIISLLDLLAHVRGNALYKCDFYGMKAGIEIRVPLLSPRLIEQMVPCSGRRKVVGRSGKRPMRRIVAGIRGKSAAWSRKIGFTPFELDAVVHERFEKVSATLARGQLRRRSKLAEDLTRREVEGFDSRRMRNINTVWRLFILEEWAARHGYSLGN